MATLIISSTLILLLGYLLVDDIEYADESILARIGLQLFNRRPQAKKAGDGTDDS